MAAAVLRGNDVLSNVVAGQLEHARFGGVVPEIASRAHQRTVNETVREALRQADLDLSSLGAVAVTRGPGLPGSLVVGTAFSRALADGLQIPLVGVNHLEGHIYSVFLDQSGPEYPFVCLIVSGGHTHLVLVEAPLRHAILGKTRDDAAGEAFDKVGKLFGLTYPAGPQIDRLASSGDESFHRFPRTSLPDFDFSFSGVKTSALYYLNDHSEADRADLLANHLPDLCASFQRAVVDALVDKVSRAIEHTGVKHAAIVGGVSANSLLRKELLSIASRLNVEMHFPALQYCTDNAAMIGAAANVQLKHGINVGSDFDIAPNLSL